MQAQENGTGHGGPFQNCFLLIGIGGARKAHLYFNAAYAARVGSHGFGYVGVDFAQRNVVRVRHDAHQAHHAASQRGAQQIGGRKGFAAAVVIGRRICNDFFRPIEGVWLRNGVLPSI